MPPDDRLPLIFVVSRIGDLEARDFLLSMMGEAHMEHHQAEEGLKALHALPTGSVHGRIIGCELKGYWWVRIVPMSRGAQEPVIVGTVQRDGMFSVSGIMIQSRYLLVVGKEKEPLKVLGIEVQPEKDNDIGAMNLSGECLHQ
jgi:hypothetical protein